MDIDYNLPLYFVYRHIRLDTGEPVYIGVGTVKYGAKKERGIFSRAYTYFGRNNTWRGIMGRTNFEVEILLVTHSRKDAYAKEVELIALYGRICLRTGPLANLSPGGEGFYHFEGPPKPEPIWVYNLNGSFYKDFPSLPLASFDTKVTEKDITRVINSGRKSANNFIFFKSFQGESIDSREKGIPVVGFDMELNKIAEFANVQAAGRELGILGKTVEHSCKNNLAVLKKFVFQYKKDLINGEIVNEIILTGRQIKFPVERLDCNMEKISSFSSLGEAAKEAKVDQKTISSACVTEKFNKKTNSFWRFKEK